MKKKGKYAEERVALGLLGDADAELVDEARGEAVRLNILEAQQLAARRALVGVHRQNPLHSERTSALLGAHHVRRHFVLKNINFEA